MQDNSQEDATNYSEPVEEISDSLAIDAISSTDTAQRAEEENPLVFETSEESAPSDSVAEEDTASPENDHESAEDESPETPETADADQAEDATETDDAEQSDEETDESDDPEQSDDSDDSESEPEEGPALPLVSVVEAILFAAREPLKPAQIARAAGKRIRQEAVKSAIDELNVQYLETGRAFEIAEISGKFQLMSRPEYVHHIMRIYPKRELSEKERFNKLTPAALDTLSIIAYKQPVTRGEIEHIRGVGCGPVLRALIERGTVKIAGKRTDLVGQPLMYGTTELFLAEFGLGSLEELPLRNEFISMAEAFAPTPDSDPAAESEPETPERTEPEQSIEPENVENSDQQSDESTEPVPAPEESESTPAEPVEEQSEPAESPETVDMAENNQPE